MEPLRREEPGSARWVPDELLPSAYVRLGDLKVRTACVVYCVRPDCEARTPLVPCARVACVCDHRIGSVLLGMMQWHTGVLVQHPAPCMQRLSDQSSCAWSDELRIADDGKPQALLTSGLA